MLCRVTAIVQNETSFGSAVDRLHTNSELEVRAFFSARWDNELFVPSCYSLSTGVIMSRSDFSFQFLYFPSLEAAYRGERTEMKLYCSPRVVVKFSVMVRAGDKENIYPLRCSVPL